MKTHTESQRKSSSIQRDILPHGRLGVLLSDGLNLLIRVYFFFPSKILVGEPERSGENPYRIPEKNGQSIQRDILPSRTARHPSVRRFKSPDSCFVFVFLSKILMGEPERPGENPYRIPEKIIVNSKRYPPSRTTGRPSVRWFKSPDSCVFFFSK